MKASSELTKQQVADLLWDECPEEMILLEEAWELYVAGVDDDAPIIAGQSTSVPLLNYDLYPDEQSCQCPTFILL